MPAVLPVGYAYRVNHAGGTEYKKYEKYHTVFARFPFLRSASVGSKPRSSQTSFPPRRGMETAAFATVFRALLGRAKSQKTACTFLVTSARTRRINDLSNTACHPPGRCCTKPIYLQACCLYEVSIVWILNGLVISMSSQTEHAAFD